MLIHWLKRDIIYTGHPVGIDLCCVVLIRLIVGLMNDHLNVRREYITITAVRPSHEIDLKPKSVSIL